MTISRRHLLGCAGAALGALPARAAAVAQLAAPAISVCGVVLPFSGADALIGDEIWRGIHLAAADSGAITMETADMPGQSGAAPAVNGLLSAHHPGLLLGSGLSSLSYPASAAAELAQVPFIELTAPADGITARGFKYLLRTGPTTSMTAALAVDTIKARFAGKRLGLLFNIGATAGAIAAAVLLALKAAKMPVILAIGYPEDVADLRDQAGRLMRAKVDVVLHAATLDGALGFALACRTLDWQPQALIGCGPGYLYRETPAALAGGLEGALVIGAPFYPASAAAIAATYQARFGMAPRAADSLTAYVGARLVFDTLASIKGDPAKLLAALRQLALPKGRLANGFGVKFDDSGQNSESFVTLQQWQGAALRPAMG